MFFILVITQLLISSSVPDLIHSESIIVIEDPQESGVNIDAVNSHNNVEVDYVPPDIYAPGNNVTQNYDATNNVVPPRTYIKGTVQATNMESECVSQLQSCDGRNHEQILKIINNQDHNVPSKNEPFYQKEIETMDFEVIPDPQKLEVIAVHSVTLPSESTIHEIGIVDSEGCINEDEKNEPKRKSPEKRKILSYNDNQANKANNFLTKGQIDSRSLLSHEKKNHNILEIKKKTIIEVSKKIREMSKVAANKNILIAPYVRKIPSRSDNLHAIRRIKATPRCTALEAHRRAHLTKPSSHNLVQSSNVPQCKVHDIRAIKYIGQNDLLGIYRCRYCNKNYSINSFKGCGCHKAPFK